MKKYLILPLLTAALASCATQELYLNVTQPAPVTIAPEIKTVGIIDRSNPTDQTRSLDNLDKLLSLEGGVRGVEIGSLMFAGSHLKEQILIQSEHSRQSGGSPKS